MPRTVDPASAPILEVFRSVQGEGAFVGHPMVFLRVRGCPLRCRYCDTPHSWAIPKRGEARIESGAFGSAAHKLERAPMLASPEQAAAWIERVSARPLPVSLTGGEPLVWIDFLLALRPLLAGRRLHLETGGAHVHALERGLSAFDHVSLDLKLAEDLDAPVEWPDENAWDKSLPQPWREELPRDAQSWGLARRRALELVRAHDACAKLVVGAGAPARFVEILDDVALFAPQLPVYLQPVSPRGDLAAPSRAELEQLLELALERGLLARVVPQTHRALKLP